MFGPIHKLAAASALIALCAAPASSAQFVSFGLNTKHAQVRFEVPAQRPSAWYGASRSCGSFRTVPLYYGGARYRYERVFVPYHCHTVWVPPVYETRYDACGRRYQVKVSEGHYRTSCSHGCWTNRRVPC
jgi:hypothetical protein